MTPYRAWAPPWATRKPVITSSKTRRAPCAAVTSRRPSRKPGAGGMTPTFAATGSTMTAAIRPGWASNVAATASTSLYGTTTVSAATASVTPALPGIDSVATPDPASTRSPSEWPW